MAMACLGFFVFLTDTVPFQQIDRSNAWRHPHQNTIGGGLPPAQYVGQEPETISISAELRPEITGGDNSIELLRQMAATGEPYTLILGNGRVLGSYVILSIKDSQTQLMHDGKARAISFGMELKKVGDSAVGLSGQALGMAAGAVRALIGI